MLQVNDIIEHPPDPSSVAADNLAGLAAGLPPGLMSTLQHWFCCSMVCFNSIGIPVYIHVYIIIYTYVNGFLY